MTREEILRIEEECRERGITRRERLSELGISEGRFYHAFRKYRREDEESAGAAEFVQLSPGTFASGAMPPPRVSGRKEHRAGEGGQMTVDLRTPGGTVVRIQGEMTGAHLRELLLAVSGNA